MGWFAAIGRPLFFSMDPERAHRVALALLGWPLPWGRIGGAADDPALATKLAGIELANPIGLAAGFDKSGRRLDSLGALGFGYVVGGTVTRDPRAGNAHPRIARNRPREAIVNAMGLPNPGAEAAAANLRKTRRTAPRLASLADEATEDAVAAAALLDPWVDGFELNASSPNAGWDHGAAHVTDVVRALATTTGKPVVVKLPPFVSDEERSGVVAMAVGAAEAGAAGLTCSNTRPVQDPRMPDGQGGLSGRPLTADTPSVVARVRAETGSELPVSACGGIFTPDDAWACLEAGAATVQVYTGLIYRGPGIVGELTSGLSKRLRRQGIALADLVGTAKPDA